MRQLPRHLAMRELLLRGELSPASVRRVAEKIADFHRDAATGEEIARLGGYDAVRQNVEENFDQTARYIGLTIPQETYDELRAYSLAFLEVREPLFHKRAREGWIRDCHGDLHTVQVFLEDGIQIIDCIEFNERFRYSDVASDIAFLAMDLDYHGRPDLSRLLVESYQARLVDRGLPAFLDFYKVYRAYVRGKVTSFLLDDPHIPEGEKEKARETARRYFDLALSYLVPLRGQALFVTAGLMGTGKTKLAQELSRRWGLHLISSDVVRKELAGIPPTEHRYEPFDGGIYSPEFSLKTYREMLRQAEALLDEGRSVILDASFRKASQRGEALSLARRKGIDYWFLECTAPEGVIRERLEQRRVEAEAVSDGRWEIFHQQRESFEPLTEVPEGRCILVDTSGAPSETLFRLLKGLYSRILQGREE